ncbi:DNA adenine methylase [Rothia nasimurium]|uniref:site-specific DNA-methyltransferase (adenine-specific) n=1 Tax=Rothia nasimurium TaxID=85336 RepID=A0A1Y1RPC3_9MICC|nr:DNA adenine methylase [Rothia nasimurium]ORC17433.1 DNA methyltransferase [Rothia nasimurium]
MTRAGASTRKRLIISPLRYPGGKGLLYPRLRTLIRENGLTSNTYVEPYAGGAGAALALLISGQVERIAINDFDPAVYAFWNAVTTQPEEFIRLVNNVELSVAEWEKQREIYLHSPREDFLSLGFATFYLNRTNRSGVLNGGPIGGKTQTGNYKIDARFNRENLAERIRLIALHAKRIEVTNEDGVHTIQRYAAQKDAFIYADPPYFEKAGSLYLNAFDNSNHQALAECLKNVQQANWILTYDNVIQVAELYPEFRRRLFALNYSAHNFRKANEIMVFSPKLTITDEIEAGHASLTG